LWRAQAETFLLITNNRLTVILKARQLGITWLVLAYALWLMLFHPAATVLVFSRREDEAKYLMERLRNMYSRLPEWMKVEKVLASNTIIWQLSNGSIAYGFPTTAGDSYTATFVMVDEADLVPDLGRLMNAVKPTIDGGGQMVLLSRVDKSQPNSMFKKIYRGAVAGATEWKSVFIPWYARPARTQEWYEAQKADILERTGSLDDLYQQYPSTDEEALRVLEMDKRIPYSWLARCYKPKSPLAETLGIPHLRLYAMPAPFMRYYIGGDPAEGNPNSDPSALTILDENGEEVGSLALQIEPAVFASYIDQIGCTFNNASVMVERNNHGHSVISWLKDHSRLPLMGGLDGNIGWMTSSKGKATVYATAVDCFKDGRTIIRSESAFYQLASIEGATLRAPSGQHDDVAMCFVLSLQALYGKGGQISTAYEYNKPNVTTNRRQRLIENQLR